MIWILLAIVVGIIRWHLGIHSVDGSLLLILLLATWGCIRISRPSPKKGTRK